MSVVAEIQSKIFHIQRMLIVRIKASCDMCFRTTPWRRIEVWGYKSAHAWLQDSPRGENIFAVLGHYAS